MAQRMIRIVVKEPGKPAEVRMVESKQEVLQEIVGGYLEAIFSPETGSGERIFAYVNEEGLVTPHLPNIDVHVRGSANPTTLVGTLFLSRCDEHGEEMGLSEEEAAKYQASLTKLGEAHSA